MGSDTARLLQGPPLIAQETEARPACTNYLLTGGWAQSTLTPGRRDTSLPFPIVALRAGMTSLPRTTRREKGSLGLGVKARPQQPLTGRDRQRRTLQGTGLFSPDVVSDYLCQGWHSQDRQGPWVPAALMTVSGLPAAEAAIASAWHTTKRLEQSGVLHCAGGWPLTACSQGQASRAASNEVVQGVVRLLSNLGTDTGGEAKHGSNGSCKGQRGLEVGKPRQC